MASLNSLYIKKQTLETLLSVLNKKQGKEAEGVELTVSLNDKENEYKQNVSAWVSQSKEQIKDKKPKFYVGNGKTFWSNSVTKQEPKQEEPRGINDDGDLPF